MATATIVMTRFPWAGSCLPVVVEDVARLRHPDDDDPSPGANYLDPGAVERGQASGSHDLVDPADLEPPFGQIQHPVDVRQHRVDLVGHEQHGGSLGSPALVDKSDDLALMAQVERQQRFVAEQQRGIGNQCLGDTDPLLLPAGQLGDRRARQFARADRREDLGHPLALPAGVEPARPQPVAVQAHPHQIGRAERSRRGQPPFLRHVADQVAAPLDRSPADRDRARGEPLPAENGPQQGGLARPVRAQHGEKLARADVEVEPRPQSAVGDRQGRPAHGQDGVGRDGHQRSALSTAATLPAIQLR